MNLTGLVDFSSELEDTFGGSCFSRIHVREDTNVPVFCEVGGHDFLKLGRAVWPKMIDLSRLEVVIFHKKREPRWVPLRIDGKIEGR